MAQLFYAPEIEKSSLLPEDEGRHCLQVLRHQKDDIIKIIDGKGYFFDGKILTHNPKKCEIKILNKLEDINNKRNYYLHIAIAPTKNIDRVEWLLEKCTEIGIDEVTFLLCNRSERKEVKIDRLEKICIQAIKQSQKALLPKINPIISFSKFLEQNLNDYSQKFIAHLVDENRKELGFMLEAKSKICILIGPEGDFDTNEVTKAIQKEFQPVTLGKSILRTETAAIMACCSVAIKNIES
ncbi:MAG: 16S rRNA (uracil(1498)-N(3))-methyltransferase [Raineya sp.]|jgi:16S rRNA (uracil1498-N3)-methyltransferase|nr:16S rRNA (uracil(1498)-N(3))-methyltransferase [Raineya sp.]